MEGAGICIFSGSGLWTFPSLGSPKGSGRAYVVYLGTCSDVSRSSIEERQAFCLEPSSHQHPRINGTVDADSRRLYSGGRAISTVQLDTIRQTN